MTHEKQHTIPKSYLRPWCDPSTPDGAFLWTANKVTKEIQQKSPRSLFTERDFYTVVDTSGQRRLELEEKLSQVEGEFVALRTNKLEKGEPLIPKDRRVIAVFAASMFARTKIQKEDQQEIWQELLDSVDQLPDDVASLLKQTDEYQRIIKLREQPMPYHMFNFVNITAPYLHSMNCAIYETKTEPGFIASDNPCFWFDPAVYNTFQPLTFFGIGSPTLEVILPVSPRQFISLRPKGPDGYFPIDGKPEAIDMMNRLTVMNSEEFIVISQNVFKDYWFEED